MGLFGSAGVSYGVVPGESFSLPTMGTAVVLNVEFGTLSDGVFASAEAMSEGASDTGRWLHGTKYLAISLVKTRFPFFSAQSSVFNTIIDF